MRFFLTNLGEHKVILGYSWFAAVQPKIDWKKGWIDSTQLPIILHTNNAVKVWYLPRQVNVPWLLHIDQYYLGKVIIGATEVTNEMKGVPEEYKRHVKLFSEKESQQLPNHTVWGHAIKLLPGAPTTLPR
jgi:hypothetical protein